MLPVFPCSHAGHADRQPRWKAMLTILQMRSSQLCAKPPTPMMYVTQLPEASTHQKYMSQKDETRGGADSIRAVNCSKSRAILYRWGDGIKMKKGGR